MSDYTCISTQTVSGLSCLVDSAQIDACTWNIHIHITCNLKMQMFYGETNIIYWQNL